MLRQRALDKSGRSCHNVAMPARQEAKGKKKKPTSAHGAHLHALAGLQGKPRAPHFKKPGFDLVVRYGRHDLRVTGTIQPEEKPSWGYDGGYPGCSACVEDMEVFMVRGDRERALGEIPASMANELEDMVFEQLDG